MSDEQVEVAISGGRLCGRVDGGVAAYRGIPFAQPPTGARRFRRPLPHPGWEGVREATRFGDSPAQPSSPYFAGLTMSEDCLTLNVWAPTEPAPARPVLVWVYGGGFVGGSSAFPAFDGARLAREGDVVVVTANHRVGALGFSTLTHRGLPEAANLGLLDIVSTLEWVRDEIAAFGGDPERVTVMGQSSGAFLSAALLGTPVAAGLFRGLVLVSGGASRIVPREQALRLGDQLLAAARVETGAELLSLASERIVAAQGEVGSQEIGRRNAPVPDSLGVVLDEEVVLRHPMAVVAGGGARAVPLFFLVTGAEVRDLRGPEEHFVPADSGAIVAELESWGIDAARAARIAEAYRDDDLGLWRERILTDYIYRLPAARAASAQSAAGGRAWLAQLDEPGGRPGGHSLPASMLMTEPPGNGATVALAARLRQAVLRFAQSGEPGWPEFAGPEGEAMMFGSADASVAGVFSELLERWEGVERP